MKRRTAKKKRYSKRRTRRNPRHGGELRGNSEDRRRRKLWMLKTFGDGKHVACVHCDKKLNYDTLTIDRIVPGCEGGRYKQGNIQPSCKYCNDSRGAKLCPLDSTQAAMFAALGDRKKTKLANPRKLRYKTVRKFKRGILRGYRPFYRRSA